MTDAVKLHRLQNWFIAFAVVVVFLGIMIPATVIIVTISQTERLQQEANETQLIVSCESLKNQRTTILGINQLRAELGIPNKIPLPELPEECAGSQ